MATAKAKALVFGDWFAQRVEFAPGVGVLQSVLYRDYKQFVGETAFGPQGFAAQLNLRKVEAKGPADKRVRWGVRLTWETKAAPVADRVTPPAKGGKSATVLVEAFPDHGWETFTFMLGYRSGDDGAKASASIAAEIHAERRRQLAPKESGGEGRTLDDDDAYPGFHLASAASAYAYAGAQAPEICTVLSMQHKPARPQLAFHILEIVRRVWPWSPDWWKPEGGPRRCLVKAGALIIAAIEKIDRAEARKQQTANAAE